MKAQSAPSPFDRVGYIIFKKCPSLLPALVKLFNICWAQSTIPGEWKCAAIKLIPKSSASEDTTNPGNFRPIALTPCVGMLFSSLLRNRYMVTNKYLDSSLQKAFMPTVPGCTEHHQKLSSILAEAHSNHKSVAVSWLDLANAYGSVHHSLIDFPYVTTMLLPSSFLLFRPSTQGYMPRSSLLSGKLQSSLFKRGCTRGTLSQW